MQNKIINKLFGDELISAMNELLKKFVSLDYEEKMIYKELKDINESVRIGIYLMALENGYDSITFRINKVNKKLNTERKEAFINACNSGNIDRFLAMLGKGDKISLMDDLGVNVDVKSRALLSKEQRKYYEILSNSIMEEQVIDVRDGIDRFIKYKKENKKEA